MITNLTAWDRLKEAVLSTRQVRSVDRLAVEKYGMHSLVLMENAALGCLRWMLDKFPQATTVTILCGRGNNGGDGLALARHLSCYGWECRVLLLGPVERLSPDALANYQILTRGGGLAVEVDYGEAVASVDFGDSEVIIDAMLGTGATGDPRPPFDGWIRAANVAQAYRVAIDIPTGVDGETGRLGTPTFKPDATLTFVARKPAMCDRFASVFGEINVLPIGIPVQLMREVLESKH